MKDLKYDKINAISAHYYNLGLDAARVRDLSGAIAYLKQSLNADKQNTDARNLLGLCLYECGETVEALASWVVSKHYDPDQNPADYYLEEVQGNTAALEAVDQAVAKYNRALEDALDGKDDIAIIQLKKAVSVHPNFVRAMLLLALLMMHENDLERADKLVRRVLAIDRCNVTALRYKQEIEAANATGKAMNSDARDVLEESFSATRLEGDAINEEVIEDGPNVMAFVSLIAGIIIGVAVVFFLIVPSREQSIRNRYIEEEKDYSENLNLKIARINSLENEVSQLTLQKTELEEALREAVEDLKYVHFDEPEQAAALLSLYAAADCYIDVVVDRKLAETTGDTVNGSLLDALAEALAKVDADKIASKEALSLYETMKAELPASENNTEASP